MCFWLFFLTVYYVYNDTCCICDGLMESLLVYGFVTTSACSFF